MKTSKQLLILLVISVSFSCKNSAEYSYAIKDFRKELQPHLSMILARGLVMDGDSALTQLATDEELVRLGVCEHPLIRAQAFNEMLDRKSFNHFDILMQHLDDTALVPVDHGEFGIRFKTVSDNILFEAEWDNQEAKDKTVEQVLTKHNHLQAAYRILLRIDPQEKFYSFIKDMATREERPSAERFDIDFHETEHAMYGLAKFKKKEDVALIKKLMMENVWKISHISLQLIQEFPDTAYMDVLHQYLRRQFFRYNGYRRDGFTGFGPYTPEPEDFFYALLAQENERSAIIFDTILNRLPTMTCMPGRKNIENDLVKLIWKTTSPVYARLRQKVKARAEAIVPDMEVEGLPQPVITHEKVRW